MTPSKSANPRISERALVATTSIGPHTTVAAFATVLAGAVVGDHCSIGSHVVIGDGAVLGDHVILEPGARVAGAVSIGDEVAIGANTVVIGAEPAPEGRPSVTVHAAVSVGANACVLAGVTIGRGAVVGAGAVLDHSVPAYAIVAGNPARITGYVSTSPVGGSTATAAAPGDASRVRGVKLIRLPVVTDLCGSLTVAEAGSGLPFTPQRYFVVYDVPSREARGEHAHHVLHQLLTCVKGECSIIVDDGTNRAHYRLDSPAVGLHLGPMVWGAQFGFSPDAVLLVLASLPYDPDDYIRDYDEFLAAVR